MDSVEDRARRTHRKSRAGCNTCKRRHIRCDQFMPTCRNCSRRGSPCDYPMSSRRRPLNEQEAMLDFPWTAPLKTESAEWIPAIYSPESQLSPCSSNLSIRSSPSPYDLSQQDLQLMHHLLYVSGNLETNNVSNLLTWTGQIPVFVQLSTSHEIVRHSLLSLSASHLGWITRSSDLDNIAARHQTLAYSSLQNAVDNFTKANSDAVFAASVILSWQAQEWRSWAALIKGETAVINAMRPWVSESIFSAPLLQHIEEADHTPAIIDVAFQPRPGEAGRLKFCIESLQRAESFMSTTEEHVQLHKGLLDFTQNLCNFPPGPTASEQFKLVYPLRGWLFWLPRSFLQMEKKDFHVLVCFAFYNATVLAIKPFFPAVGAVFYRNTQTNAIMQIHCYLTSALCRERSEQKEDKHDLEEAIRLVGYAVEIAAEYWNERSGGDTLHESNMDEGTSIGKEADS